ncbi:MAG: class I SAM-dependent methyltransferase [Bacteroidota bacterium]|nr:class I SAM-dependent methyltransferase [Bacteroidota bacterium]
MSKNKYQNRPSLRFMAFYHYFSNNPDKRAKFIFNTIAPIYSGANKLLADNFARAVEILAGNTYNYSDKSIIDIGTGTGAWIAAMDQGLNPTQVAGTDFSARMIKQAKKSYPSIDFFYGNGERLSQIPDNSYHVATASFVLHGVKADKRRKILNEMSRIASDRLVFQDFIGKTPVMIKILEFLERSDYKNFKNHFCNELKDKYNNCYSEHVRSGTGVYVVDLNTQNNYRKIV